MIDAAALTYGTHYAGKITEIERAFGDFPISALAIAARKPFSSSTATSLL